MNVPSNIRSRSIRVLVLEDSDDVLFLLETELASFGYVVIAAQDGLHALDMARRLKPDIIVSDIRMPEMNGFEFLDRVRRIPELAFVPVVALTGFGTEREIECVLAQGFNAHLKKPADASVLSSLIQQLIGETRALAS